MKYTESIILGITNILRDKYDDIKCEKYNFKKMWQYNWKYN